MPSIGGYEIDIFMANLQLQFELVSAQPNGLVDKKRWHPFILVVHTFPSRKA